MAGLGDPGTVMQGNGWGGLQPVDVRVGHPARTTDRHVHRTAGLVGEVVQFGGGVVAESGARPGPQHRTPKLRHPGRLAGKGQVDAAVEGLPAATAQLAADGVGGQPTRERLPARDDSVLEVGEFLAWAG
jgi:hypothetical protein